LNITVTGRVEHQLGTLKKANHAESKEILADAHLKLKPGVRYGLFGRNGTGKSSASYLGSNYFHGRRLMEDSPFTSSLREIDSINVLPVANQLS
jgi:ABC-type hemin transport system ATPase subunit